ncbi:hypothetical protein ACF0H5_006359 [Mactra antiquata]
MVRFVAVKPGLASTRNSSKKTRISNNELDELFSVKDLQELFGNEAMFRINGIRNTQLRKPKLKTVGINTEQQHDIQQQPIVNKQQHDIHQQTIVNGFQFEMPPPEVTSN